MLGMLCCKCCSLLAVALAGKRGSNLKPAGAVRVALKEHDPGPGPLAFLVRRVDRGNLNNAVEQTSFPVLLMMKTHHDGGFFMNGLASVA